MTVCEGTKAVNVTDCITDLVEWTRLQIREPAHDTHARIAKRRQHIWSSLCAGLCSTHSGSRRASVVHIRLRMPELTGRQVRLLGLSSQEPVQSRCLRCCRTSSVKRKRAACTAYRDDLEQNSAQHQAPARSTLLSARTRLKQQDPATPRNKLFRRAETPPVPVLEPEEDAPEEDAPSTSGRLLRRSKPIGTTSSGLTRATATLSRSQQDRGIAQKVTLDAKHKQPDKRKAWNNTRFSQEAGRLSQKDWQVLIKSWTPRLAKLTNRTIFFVCTGHYRLADH